MNDIATDPSVNGSGALLQTLAELERRVQFLEAKVAALPDAQQMEERVAQKMKAELPPPPPNPSEAPGLRDIEVPIPSVQTVVKTAKATWLIFEMLAELRLLFWTLFDRRYHMAWMTRFITIAILVMVMTSDFWFPLATYDNVLSRTWDKAVNVLFCLTLFLVLNFETRRYKEWRHSR